MASSSSTVSDIEGRWVEISLEEEDEVGISIEGVEKEEVAVDTRWFLPGKGMYVKELEPNLFLFEFYHEVDMQKVLVGSSWTFDKKQLIIPRLKLGENSHLVKLNHLDLGSIFMILNQGKNVTHEREKEVISKNRLG
ncbi:hypothetical protein G4B88_026711 [Cannabis sativa]|uniref:DUF4283 domain-containing protein n=1 Tax=Cannabis sativa TaxID=3483 RepID=A0A7J6DUR4_CANSA|nr:hypothetical protein G4B88_026711 [Cannabis sativa]